MFAEAGSKIHLAQMGVDRGGALEKGTAAVDVSGKGPFSGVQGTET